MDQPKETIQELEALIHRAQSPDRLEADGAPFIILRQDERAEDVEKLLLAPTRKRGKPAFSHADSFCSYVNVHKTDDTRVYVPSPVQFLAVINGHGKTPGWGDHVAALNLKTTPEWNTWSNQASKRLDQRTFATFIEDNVDDVVNPTGAEMLDLVRVFQSTQSADFKSVTSERPGNNKLEYTQVAATKAGSKGDVELPERFLLGLSVYEGGPVNQIVARLRYSINESKLVLWYDLFRVQKFVDLAVRGIGEQITKETGIEIWFGQP